MIEYGLVGYTGTVGKSILDKLKLEEGLYNSSNIEDIDGMAFDTLILAGIPANKVYANSHPEEDLNNIKLLIEHIKKSTFNKLVLISTIDVYGDDSYGRNRGYAEDELKSLYSNIFIVRLPGLYGKYIKKNVIFDIMNPIPKYIKQELYDSIYSKNTEISKYYIRDNDIYNLINEDKKLLKILKDNNCTALKFTNINSTFQWFNLEYIVSYINNIINNNIHEYDISSEPIPVREIAAELDYIDEDFGSNVPIVLYNEVYGEIWKDKDFIINDILNFIKEGVA